MWQRLLQIIRKEFIQAFREPRMRVMMIVPPLMQLIIFGYAVNLDVENAKLAWVDLDHSGASRELRAAFEGSAYFTISAFPTNEEQVQAVLDRGQVQAVVQVLPGFSSDIERGKTAAVQVLVDGSNSNTASIVSNYATRVIAAYAETVRAAQQGSQILARAAPGSGPADVSAPVLTARTRVWFNSELLSRDYFVPGVIANIILMITLMLTAMAIVREKEIGTMEQLMVTPIRPIELILGKTLPFAVVGLVDVILMTVLALLIFKVPLHGRVWFLLCCSSVYLLTSLGIGLFISTISHTQQQAMMSSFFFTMPAFMLSGFAFPIRNMPVIVQYVTYLNPLRYFMEIVRGIFLKGIGFSILWPQLLILLLYGVLILGVSALRFHKRLD
jgi:drug efflux transport system permease protein